MYVSRSAPSFHPSNQPTYSPHAAPARRQRSWGPCSIPGRPGGGSASCAVWRKGMERSGERRRPDSVERVSAPLSLSFSLAWGRGEAACVWDGWVRVCSLNVPAWCAPWLEETAREKEQRRARSELSERARVPDQPCLLTPSSPPPSRFLPGRRCVGRPPARPGQSRPLRLIPRTRRAPPWGFVGPPRLSLPPRGERERKRRASNRAGRPAARRSLSLPPRRRLASAARHAHTRTASHSHHLLPSLCIFLPQSRP